MITFSLIDFGIIILFFISVLLIGFYASQKQKNDSESFLLSGRNVGLFLFVLTNVATWYGGILGVGEFTYRYGLVSWFTQGLPYYIFAIIFAIFFAPKIRKVSLFTIPEKLTEEYGELVGKISAILIFILVSPAPYLLMFSYLISLVFDISIVYSLLVGIGISTAYLYKGGYRANIYTDAVQFFTMFIGFIVLFVFSFVELGDFSFLQNTLPESHLSLTGGNSPAFIIVWFLIATWTFTDPGFHQRCYSAKSVNIAKYGIIISVIFWALFDLLTTSTGLFARAALGEINNPLLAFPLLAEKILGDGTKGIFYAGLFATILSTLNSFMFLSATTIGRDFLHKTAKNKVDDDSVKYTKYGLVITSIFSFILAYYFDSVVDMWYTIGSICIPGLILLIIGAYQEKQKISNKIALLEILSGVLISSLWFLIRPLLPPNSVLSELEPMIVGLGVVLVVHLIGLRFEITPKRQ